MNIDIITTRELLDAMPQLSESTLRSLVRRKYVHPQHRGGFYFWTPDDMAKLNEYLEPKNEWRA